MLRLGRLAVLLAFGLGLGSLVLPSPAIADGPGEERCPTTIVFAIVVEEGAADRATASQLMGTILGRVGKIEPEGCYGAMTQFFFDTNPFTDKNPGRGHGHAFDILIAVEKSPLNPIVWFLTEPFEEAPEHVVEAVTDEGIRAKAEELFHNRVLDVRDPLGELLAKMAAHNGWIGGAHGQGH